MAHIHEHTTGDSTVGVAVGTILGIILAIVLGLLLFWFVAGSRMFAPGTGTNININPPAQENPPQQVQPRQEQPPVTLPQQQQPAQPGAQPGTQPRMP